MPNSFIYVESYSEKAVDLTKMEDAIMSAAKFLHKKAKFKTLIDWKKMPYIPEIEAQWYEYEHKYRYENCSFVYEKGKNGKVYRCFTAQRDDLKYLREYTKKIMRYNNSSNYAVGVMRLAYDAYHLRKGK
jgi:membrane-bound lytic murein transglycosylase B